MSIPIIDQQISFNVASAGATFSVGPFTKKFANEFVIGATNSQIGRPDGYAALPSAGGSSFAGVAPVASPFNVAWSAPGIGNNGTGIIVTCTMASAVTPTAVNATSGSAGGAVASFPVSPTLSTIGNTIVLQVQQSAGHTNTSISVTSALGNPLTLIGYKDQAQCVGLFMGVVLVPGSETFTVTAVGGVMSSPSAAAIEYNNLVPLPTIIGAAQHLYEYESIALNERTLVSTAADSTGATELNNEVDYFNAAGVPTKIFTPSATATNVRAVDSRDYMYFADGVSADLKKWHIANGLSKWGIVAPASNVVVGSATGGGSLTFPLSAAANHSGANTTYTGTGLSGLQGGTSVQIGGFVNSGNNGTFTVVSSTPTTVVVNNGAGVAESATATLTTQNLLRPSTLLNGWGGNAHVGSYEGGVSQGFAFGLDPGSTGAYSNPGNAFDGDPTTFASFAAQHTHVYGGCVWSFAGISSSATNVTLNILSEVPPSGTDGNIVTLRSAGIWYSIDGGSTWTQIYNASTFTKAYSQVAIPNGTTLSNVQVMAFSDSHDNMYHKVYDIYMQATFTGSGPITLQSGRVYFEAFQNSVTGHISDVSIASPSTGAVFGGSIPLTLISTSPDPQVDTEIILATADGGDQTELFFLASLPIGTTTYLDQTPEVVLLQANTYASVDDSGTEHGIINSIPPPNGLYPIKHQGRLWLIQNNVLFFSKSLGDLTTSTGLIAGKYEEAWDPADQFDISEGAETGVGLFSDGVNLYIGTKRHIRRLQGDNPLNFVLPQIMFNDVGLNNQEVWQAIFLEGTPAGVMWMTPDFRVIRSDFNTYNNVGESIQTTLDTINPSASQTCWAQYVGEADQNFYVLAIPTGSNTLPDTLCVYNIARGTWFIWQCPALFLSGLYYMNYAGIPRFLVCSSAGVIYLIDPSQVTDNLSKTFAVPITSTVQTTWLAFGDPQLRKVLNEIEVQTSDALMTVTVEGATTEAQFATPNLVVANAPLTTNFLGDFKVYLAGYPTIDRFYRFTFTSASLTPNLLDELIEFFSMEAIPYHRF